MSEDFGLAWCRPITHRLAKERIAALVARRAAAGDVIGAGSGSTSFLTVIALGRRAAAEGLDISIVPTSLEIQFACDAVGLRVHASVPNRVDWCFDGADEVDPQRRLIKGRGGALYRERLVFSAAAHRLIIADATKTVNRLGSVFPVPVEVEPIWARRADHALRQIESVESVDLRLGIAKDGPVITESGGLIFDVRFAEIDGDTERRVLSIPGVRCTGIFSGFEYERLSEDVV